MPQAINKTVNTWRKNTTVKKEANNMSCSRHSRPLSTICRIPALEVVKLQFILKLKIKRNDWLLADASNQSMRFILSLRLYSSFITSRPGPEVIKLFPCLTQLSTKFILLIIVKMPTIVGILTLKCQQLLAL